MVDSILRYIRSRTLLFSALLVGLGVIEANWSVVAEFVPPKYQGLLFVGIGVVVAMLRVVTTKPLNEK